MKFTCSSFIILFTFGNLVTSYQHYEDQSLFDYKCFLCKYTGDLIIDYHDRGAKPNTLFNIITTLCTYLGREDKVCAYLFCPKNVKKVICFGNFLTFNTQYWSYSYIVHQVKTEYESTYTMYFFFRYFHAGRPCQSHFFPQNYKVKQQNSPFFLQWKDFKKNQDMYI